ncbi:MAG: 50S ribosomal protein L23 [Bacilli bacterium]|nr:50S ribosomal protein L23 [Bacilli bacterium]MDD4407643.1 50S ribosomal protein L23 [Bacilli bacterium]
MMDLNIIYSPVITEKSSALAEDGKTYVFKVDKRANKTQIKLAIEKAFGVKVKSINTLNTKPKKKRVGKYTGLTKTYKKAIVTLVDGQTIEM